MKIVFMGTPDFAQGILEALVAAGHEITAAVTQPDKPAGRGKGVSRTPVKESALRYGIPVFQPVKIREEEQVRILKGFEADVYVVAAFGQILSQEILDIPPLGCVNVHASLLPKYRGSSPIQQAILDGESKTGVTIMKMDAGVDTGDILSAVTVKIAPEDTGESLFEKLKEAGAELLVNTLPKLEKGMITPVKQDGAQATHTRRITKEDGLIDWNESAQAIERKVRAYDPWPSAYTMLDGKQFKIRKACVLPEDSGEMREAGTVVQVTKDAFAVACGRGRLTVKEVQLAGKKQMPVKDFLLGYPLAPGEKLGEQAEQSGNV